MIIRPATPVTTIELFGVTVQANASVVLTRDGEAPDSASDGDGGYVTTNCPLIPANKLAFCTLQILGVDNTSLQEFASYEARFTAINNGTTTSIGSRTVTTGESSITNAESPTRCNLRQTANEMVIAPEGWAVATDFSQHQQNALLISVKDDGLSPDRTLNWKAVLTFWTMDLPVLPEDGYSSEGDGGGALPDLEVSMMAESSLNQTYVYQGVDGNGNHWWKGDTLVNIAAGGDCYPSIQYAVTGPEWAIVPAPGSIANYMTWAVFGAYSLATTPTTADFVGSTYNNNVSAGDPTITEV